MSAIWQEKPVSWTTVRSAWTSPNTIVFMAGIALSVYLLYKFFKSRKGQKIIKPIQDAITVHRRNRIARELDLPPFPRDFLFRPWKRDASSIGEQVSKDFLEKLFDMPFDKARPDWLRNPKSDRNLELDCYNEELGLALEYNGEQHYIWPNGFNMSFENFQAQRERDLFKRRRCKEEGVRLITVPYKVKPKDIPDYIYNKLIEMSADKH